MSKQKNHKRQSDKGKYNNNEPRIQHNSKTLATGLTKP